MSPKMLTDSEIQLWIIFLSHQIFTPIEIADELASNEICWSSGRSVTLTDVHDVLRNKPV
jgi:hypothetical protein